MTIIPAAKGSHNSLLHSIISADAVDSPNVQLAKPLLTAIVNAMQLAEKNRYAIQNSRTSRRLWLEVEAEAITALHEISHLLDVSLSPKILRFAADCADGCWRMASTRMESLGSGRGRGSYVKAETDPRQSIHRCAVKTALALARSYAQQKNPKEAKT